MTGKHATTYEPDPIRTDGEPLWPKVIVDMHERDVMGREKYGTALQAHNGRDPAVDAYQEVLDLAVYLKQLIQERADLKQELADAKSELKAIREFYKAQEKDR